MRNPLADLVRDRAGNHCEYCLLAQMHSSIPFQVDHIIALKHHGENGLENLALACVYCNSSKGPNIAGIDPLTRAIAPLFHPRRDSWQSHFQWNGAELIGLTPSGRATVDVLAINDPNLLTLRQALLAEGVFPSLPQVFS
ncbi:HNH endonuclease [Anatilimnocola floriformis]|uniref:HNH endonuclease n=1 Tax=Anatilimnocola floriformis TaxID=2948575 RepID=UPI0028F44A5C|nr:HNH endonuclease signature motif containing protein [Anatilimnocola floriformis]